MAGGYGIRAGEDGRAEEELDQNEIAMTGTRSERPASCVVLDEFLNLYLEGERLCHGPGVRVPTGALQKLGMSIDFTFQNLVGAPYRGGAVCMFHDTLLTPVGNRVSQVRLRPTCIFWSEHAVRVRSWRGGVSRSFPGIDVPPTCLINRFVPANNLRSTWSSRHPRRCRTNSAPTSARFACRRTGRCSWPSTTRGAVW